MVTPRNATLKDKDEILRLQQQLYSPDPSLEAEIEAYFDGKSKIELILVAAKQNGGLGAFIELSQMDHAEGRRSSSVAYVEGIYVDGNLRRTGVGRQLVEAAETWARQHGFTELASDTKYNN